MFLDFYDLKDQPFGVTPDPHYLYLGASHREALASLFYAVKTGRGLSALIAPPGMGKTTLLFRFLEHLRGAARTAFLFQTQCDSCGLLRYLLGDLGISARGQDFVTMHEQLNEVLLREARAGRRFVLVIDEAQNLDDSVLETARLLTDFETPREKLLQIVFAGQSQLAEKLERPELAQLRQRIAILGRLEPFRGTEINHYIDHRLRVAGYSAGPLFTPGAIDRIATSSKGVPRNINNLCFNAMSLGCALGRKQIDADLVSEAEADLDLSSLAEQRRRELLPAAGPVPTVPQTPAVETMICRGAGATPTPVDTAGFAQTNELSTWNDYRAWTRLSFDLERDAFVVGEGTEVLILESLEAAEERNAEILAELVSYAPSDDTDYFTQPADDGDGACRVVTTAMKDLKLTHEDVDYLNAHRTSNRAGEWVEAAAISNSFDEHPKHLQARSTKPIAGHLLGGTDRRDVTTRLPFSYCVGKQSTLGRSGVFACVSTLALLAVLLYQENIKIVAAAMGRSVVVATVSLSSHHGAFKSEPAAPTAALESVSAEKGPELTEQNAVLTLAAPALTTSGMATQAGASVTPVRNQQALTPITHASSLQGQRTATGTITVIVQPHDDLRRICVRYVGWYDSQLINLISKLNPGLTDPDRVAVGQRVVLPVSTAGGTDDSRTASVPRP
jgi:type II secretory pathway predicted ATPase ExeA